MPHHEANATTISLALELLTANGFEGMSEALRILFNEAMKIERSTYLDAAPYERVESRRGYANGYKAKTVLTRVGALALQLPQVREADENGELFYPSALSKALIYDEPGTWVLAKHLDKGTFSWPSSDTKETTIEYGEEQLALLLGGFDAPVTAGLQKESSSTPSRPVACRIGGRTSIEHYLKGSLTQVSLQSC